MVNQMNTNINNLNKKINSILKKKIFVIKPEVNLCVSALGWVGGWIFSVVPDRWKHWNHSHRSKTHSLPNKNVLAVNLPHKQAFEGRWVRRRTDGRHSRVNTHAEGQTGAGWTQTIIGQVSDGQPVEKKRGGIQTGVTIRSKCTINSSTELRKLGK